MRKIFTFILALTASVGTMFAEEVKIGDLYYALGQSIEGNVASVLPLPNDEHYTGDIVIPDTVTYNNIDYPVKGISAKAFLNCTALTSVTLPETITEFFKMAFQGCIGLTSIVIPNGVKNIADQAFYGCTNLKNVTLPESLTGIGQKAFEGCTSLTSVNIPEQVTEIYGYTFSGCSSLTSITIPNGVTEIGMEAFSLCTGLKSITLGSGLTSMDTYAFAGCSQLTSITCKAINPPTCSNDVFGSVPTTIPVYVPKESVADYKAKDGWKAFGDNIQAFPPQTKEMTPTIGHLGWDEKDQQWSITVYEYAGEDPKFVFAFAVDGAKNVLPTTMTITNSTDDNYVFSDIINPEDFSGSIKDASLSITLDGTGYKYDNVGGMYYVNAKISGEMSDADGNKLIVKEPTSFIKVFVPSDIATALDQITNDQSPITNKVIRDGQLFILRGDKTYTITGQEVK